MDAEEKLRREAVRRSFFVLNVVDLGRHAAASELVPSKADRATAEGLLRAWRRLGIPRRLQLDNWLIATTGPHLGPTVRLRLALGVTVVFIPFAEPWRPGTVEQYDDTFDKRFFRSERFRDLGHPMRRMAVLERSHGAHHRYAALQGATPDEAARASAHACPIRRSRSPSGCRGAAGSSSSASSAPTAGCAGSGARSRFLRPSSTSTSPPSSTSRGRS